jgi:Icc-related predicted phosphoesterase
VQAQVAIFAHCALLRRGAQSETWASVGMVSKSRPSRRRLLFVSDLHGSTAAFRKLLDAPAAYGVDALICGGDIAGTRLYPIVKGANGHHVLHDGSSRRALDGHAALADARAALEASGGYPITMTESSYAEIEDDPAASDALLTATVRARIEEWIALAEDRLGGTGIKCYVIGGNHDNDEMLQPLLDARSDTVIASEGRIVEVLGQPMVSMGWSHPTPCGTPRETSEEQLERMLEAAVAELDDPGQAIFNLHPPPKNSRLDRFGEEPNTHAAGSSAVAETIRNYQPLVGLHGHIHGSPGVRKIGRTVCINPGSKYRDGALLGAVVSLAAGKVVDYQLVRG